MRIKNLLQITWITAIFFSLTLAATGQSAPQKINYQAVARDDNGNVMQQQTIDVYFTILDESDASVYEEEHTGITTNDYGLFSVGIGNGNTQSGTFADIGWGSGQHKVKVEVDNGSGYADMGTSMLNSVPYSLYAEETSAWESGSGIVYNENDKVFVGRSGEISPSEVFGIKATGGNYGGMYIDSEEEDARPFYGYSNPNSSNMWTYYEVADPKWHVNFAGTDRFTVVQDGKVGINQTSPQAPLDITGANNWNLEETEGDVRIGGPDNRIKISMSTGGAGAGHARINAFGENAEIRIGAYAKDILKVDSSGTGLNTSDNYPREEDLHIVQNSAVGNPWAGLQFEKGASYDPEVQGNEWSIGITNETLLNDFDWYYNGTLVAAVDNETGEWQSAGSSFAIRNAEKKSFTALDKILQLNPRKFSIASKNSSNDNSFLGFKPEELNRAFPSLVDERNDRFGISYARLSVVSIKAIQEQQETIDKQKKQIKELQKELDEIKDAFDEAGISIE